MVTTESIAAPYGLDPSVVQYFEADVAMALKFSFPPPVSRAASTTPICSGGSSTVRWSGLRSVTGNVQRRRGCEPDAR
jgi:hypothetical protein